MPSTKKALKAVVVAGTHSGAGKTTITLGLMAALRRRGLRVAPFKVGPDFIDPGHHRVICGKISRNLDGWMMNRETNRTIFHTHCRDADIAVVEGVMGLYDGFSGQSEAGSTAEMAKWLQAPVLLVVDARSMARSAAALVQGFETFDNSVPFAGVLFNRLGSDAHLDYVRTALEGHVRMPCIGGIFRSDEISLPERHLGLVTAEDHPLSEAWASTMADMVGSAIDIDAFLDRLPPIFISPATAADSPLDHGADGKRRIRIGWAHDRAFCFYYADNLELLAQQGADLVPFSPIADRSLPPDLDGIYFGGGYPELHAGQLAQNETLRHQVLAASQGGMPIYGECGGLMYLCAAIEDTHGNVHDMTSCFPMRTRMTPHLRRLGYREVTLTQDTIIGLRGTTIRGHEFHYSEFVASSENHTMSDTCRSDLYEVTDRAGGDRPARGYLRGRTLGSYIHLHFGSRPEIAAVFIDNCRVYRQERKKTYEPQ